MRKSRDQILKDVLLLLQKLAEDWEYDRGITEDTYLFADMGLESLDIVVLAAAVQEHYGQVLPFPEFFAEIGQRELRDVSVSEWVDFVHKHLDEDRERSL